MDTKVILHSELQNLLQNILRKVLRNQKTCITFVMSTRTKKQIDIMRENTHLSQRVESYEALASLSDTDGQMDGVAQIRITVTNESFVSVDTCGRSRGAFQDLKSDVVTKLWEEGYEVKNLNIDL